MNRISFLALASVLAFGCGGGNPADASDDTGGSDVVGSDAVTDTPASTDSPAMESGGPMTHVVTVGATGTLAFAPADLTIAVGDTVRWEFRAAFHNVVSGSMCGMPDNTFCFANNTNCAMAATAPAGGMYQFRFMTAGTFPYFCSPHCVSGMRGNVTVR